MPRLEIEERSDCVTVRFRRAGYVPTRLEYGEITAQQRVILTLLHESNEGLALREIRTALEFRISERQLQHHLTILKAKGLVKVIGVGRGS